MKEKKVQKGNLLIAEPSLASDLIFSRSIVLLTDHSTDGSVGFIINKPLQYTLNDLIPDIDSQFQIYNGGPVDQDNLYFIHNLSNLIPNSIEISDGIFWGGDFLNIKELINTNQISKKNIRFFLGYSGWTAQQLQDEIEENAWIVFDNNYKEELLQKKSVNFWKEKINELGGDYLIWSNAPENPILN